MVETVKREREALCIMCDGSGVTEIYELGTLFNQGWEVESITGTGTAAGQAGGADGSYAYSYVMFRSSWLVVLFRTVPQ